MAPGVLEKQNVFWGIVCAKSKQLISKNKPILGEKENSSSITAVKPPFLTFSATVQGWDCSHFSQSIQHTHTHTQAWAKMESHMCGTCCAQSLFSLTERSFPGGTFMHARFKALGAKGTPGAPDVLPNGPKWGGSAVTMSRDCFYQACCSAHTLKGTHTLMYLLKQLIILLQVHDAARDDWWVELNLDGQGTRSHWSMSSLPDWFQTGLLSSTTTKTIFFKNVSVNWNKIK